MDNFNNTTNQQNSKTATKRHLRKLYRACRYALLLNKQHSHLINLKIAFKKGVTYLDPFTLSALVSALLELVDLQSDYILEAIKLGADEIKQAA